MWMWPPGRKPLVYQRIRTTWVTVGVLLLVIKEDTRVPVAERLSLKANMYFFFTNGKLEPPVTLVWWKISEKPTSGQRSKHWFPAADKGNVTVFAFNVSGLILLSPDLVTSGRESDREFITIPVLSVLLCLLTALWRHLGSISGATSFTNQLLAQSLGVSRR